MIQKKEVTMFFTSDGKKFDYENEAIEHEIEFKIYSDLPTNPSSMSPYEFIFVHRASVLEMLKNGKIKNHDDKEISVMEGAEIW